MEEGTNRFGEEVRVLRSKRILRTREDYVKAFGLNVDGCKVFPNPEEEGIYIKCPLSEGRFQVYKAILIDEREFDGLYVFYPSWIDYHLYLERWKKKHHWKTMTLSEVQEARKNVRMESIDDSEQRAFFVFCVVLYALALLVSPALIVTAVLTHDWSIARGNRVYSDGGLSTCVTTSQFFMGKILVKNATKKGYLEAEEGDGIDCGTRMQYHRGTVQSGMSQTIKTTIDVAALSEGKLRKLTPLECMRLMGFSDKDEQAMRSIGMSDSAIYHCAGDSIVVDVLMDIFKELL